MPDTSEVRTATSSSRSDALLVIGVALAALAFLASTITFAFAASDDDGGGSGSAGGGAPTSVSVSLAEFSITPTTITIAAGGTLDITNAGTVEHDLAVKDHEDTATSDRIAGGGTTTLALGDLEPGTYDVYCTVPGHEASGMKATLVIEEGGGGGAATNGESAAPTTTEMDPEAMDDSAHARMAEFPAETEGEGGAVLPPTVLPDGTKVFELTVDVIQWEVEPGKMVEAWAYNEQIPGPTLEVLDGDNVRINVTNNLEESTTVHWHGIDVPNEMDGVPDVTQEQIKPGTTFTYEFQVTGPAVGMYHAHSNSQKQVPMGLSAGMIVADLPMPAGTTITQELPFIVNDGGQLGFTINGKAFPATKPITAKVGESILVHYFNEGLQVHPMHLHGPTQLVVAKDGHPLPAPYLADTVLVGPGERYSVVVTPNRPGTWVWHCHILTHAEAPEGFIGMTTALIVT